MPITGLGHYNLRAPRELLESLRAFYCDVIGLSTGKRPPFRSFGYWLYAGDLDILHLTESSPEEVRVTNVSTTFDHVAFAAEGRLEMESRLRTCAIAFKTNQVPLTGQVQLFMRDPAGNGVELTFAADDPETQA
ncbi:MAG: diguanylate cyclase [Xanthomonadales bacterium]|nr:diguanylate cyclase [Xanthomonadales bacterium]